LADYQYIDTEKQLTSFYKENKNVEWIGFDTEFVGENRYNTLLCLIQVATSNGNYLLDPLKLKTLDPLFKLIKDPKILVITHAGQNDYRILYQVYKVVPKNIFDTQLAAGYLGYRYPVSFQKLLRGELGVSISKTYTVTNWEKRPLGKKQINYALNDIIHLKELYESLLKKLKTKKYWEWAQSEMARYTQPTYFKKNKHHEALNSKLMKNLNQHQQVFLLRLYEWRDQEASLKNRTKEQILPKRLMGTIVRNIAAGKDALKDNRTIPNKSLLKNWSIFNNLFQKKNTKAERDLLLDLPVDIELSEEMGLTNEMLFILVKQKCQESGIAQSLVLQKNEISKAQMGERRLDFLDNWRKEFLGDDFVNLLTAPGKMKMKLSGRKVSVTFTEKPIMDEKNPKTAKSIKVTEKPQKPQKPDRAPKKK